MSRDYRVGKKGDGKGPRNSEADREKRPKETENEGQDLNALQRRLGNRAVQRMLTQRSGDGPFNLDDETAGRIERERGAGQPLETAIQKKMSHAMGKDLKGIRVHTSSEADSLSRKLRAKAFTTGKDVFFRSGSYDPHTSGGQELIAHELSHVLQQETGQVAGGDRMTVSAPGDEFEKEADVVAKKVVGAGGPREVQRQEEGEEEEELQMKAEAHRQPLEEEEEELQMKREAQRQEEEEEEEETVQLQPEEGYRPLGSLQMKSEGKGLGLGDLGLKELSSIFDQVVRQSMEVKFASLGEKAKKETGEEVGEKLKQVLEVKEDKEEEKEAKKK